MFFEIKKNKFTDLSQNFIFYQNSGIFKILGKYITKCDFLHPQLTELCLL